MIGKILFSLASLVFFIYIFIFKLIRKNDTTYLTVLVVQAIGILINLMQIIFGIAKGLVFDIFMFLFCLVIPIVIIGLEFKNINFSELLSIVFAKTYLYFENKKRAKDVLIKLVSKYDKSYYGHKMLAEIYEQEGGMRKAIDEYVKVLDIRGNDYKSYFKISKLLKDLEKKDEAIQMLQTLVKKKPELYEANRILGELLLERGNFKEATYLYSEAIKHNEDKPDLYYNLGIAYTRVNEFALAKECYLKTVDLDSNNYNAYYRLGQIALLYRDINSAEGYFLQSIYGEVESKAYYQLAKIYMMKNNKNKAAIFLNNAIEISEYYYDQFKEEPIFFPIKQLVVKSESAMKKKPQESETEKEISDYLDNTYDLTKVLNEKKNKNNNNRNKFKIN